MRIYKYLLVISCCLCFNSLLHATTSRLESDSPFLPPGYNKRQPPPIPVPQSNSLLARELELRGVVQLDGIYYFSLFKKSENISYWIPENGSESGIEVSNFDPNRMEITVTVSGRSEQITLIKASENSLPVVTNTPLPTPAVQAPNLPTGIPLRKSDVKPPSGRAIPRRRVIIPNRR